MSILDTLPIDAIEHFLEIDRKNRNTPSIIALKAGALLENQDNHPILPLIGKHLSFTILIEAAMNSCAG